MMAAFDWNGMAQVTSLRIADCLVEGTVIAMFAGVALRFARRVNSGTRFAVWFSALMTIAALPLVSGVWSSHGGAVAAARRAAIVVPESWALYLFTAWAVVAAWGLLRVGAGLLHLRALRKSCEAVDLDSLNSALREALSRHADLKAAVCVSDEVSVPTAIGFGQAAVLIPRWLMMEMSAGELNQILLHELAHLRRRDDWTNLAQKIVAAVLFFHPAVWWIEKRISLEREMACDDAVLAATSTPRAYAECLARLAEKSFLRRSMALAQAAVGRMRQTSLRVAQILDGSDRTARTPGWKPAVSVLAGMAMACAVGAFRTPQIIAFQDHAPAHSSRPTAMVASNSGALPELEHSGHLLGAKVWKAMAVAPSAPVMRPRHKRAPVFAQPHVAAEQEIFESSLADERPQSSRDENVQVAGSRVLPVVSTETVLVVVEGSYATMGAPLYQISVWRITVVSPTQAVIGKAIPHKT